MASSPAEPGGGLGLSLKGCPPLLERPSVWGAMSSSGGVPAGPREEPVHCPPSLGPLGLTQTAGHPWGPHTPHPTPSATQLLREKAVPPWPSQGVGVGDREGTEPPCRSGATQVGLRNVGWEKPFLCHCVFVSAHVCTCAGDTQGRAQPHAEGRERAGWPHSHAPLPDSPVLPPPETNTLASAITVSPRS